MEELLHATDAAAQAANWPEATRLAGCYATALRRHADLEDEVLFPAYEQACGGFGDGPIAHMREEHVDVRRGIDQLLRAVTARDAAAVAAAREHMQQAAIEHHAKEEEILFPAIDELFPADALDALVRRLMTF
jgi:hemerythrin-like domain-containing protein